MNTKFLSLAVLVVCAPVSADASFGYMFPWSSQPASSTVIENVVDVATNAASVTAEAAKRSVDVVSVEEAPSRLARMVACMKAAPKKAWSATKSGVHAVVTAPVNFASWAQKFYWTEATGFQRSYRLTLTAALATAAGYGSYKLYEKYNTEKAA